MISTKEYIGSKGTSKKGVPDTVRVRVLRGTFASGVNLKANSICNISVRDSKLLIATGKVELVGDTEPTQQQQQKEADNIKDDVSPAVNVVKKRSKRRVTTKTLNNND